MRVSYFITKFDATLLDEVTRQGRRLWRLDSPLMYYSASLDLIINAPTGFVTDLESCPRWPLIFWLVGDIAYEEAALHDFVYAHGMFTRLICDNLLREACLAMGMPEWQVQALWAGVRVGGAGHYGSQYTTN